MASEVRPDPITTNYIPEAWDEAMTATQRNKALEANYIKLSPQNYPITFLNSISVPISSTLDTRFATTSMINTFWTAFRTTFYIWTGEQTFDEVLLGTSNVGSSVSTMDIGTDVTDNINLMTHPNRAGILNLGNGTSATGAVRIGTGTSATNNVQILNGSNSTGTINLGSATSTTRLGRSLTPNYSYPVSSGKIGYIAPVTFVTDALTSNGSNSLRSVELTVGVWFLFGSFSCSTNAGSNNISFNSLNIARKGTWQYSAGQPTPPWGLSTCTTIYVSTTETYTLCARNDSGGTATNVSFIAIRIA